MNYPANRKSKRLWTPGEQFGRLTAIGPESKLGDKWAVLCHCICGNEKVVRLSKLRSGRTRSCGCLRAEKSSARMPLVRQANGSGFQVGSANSAWRGDDVKYMGAHGRVYRARGKAADHLCTQADDTCKGPMHWANLIGQYSDTDDYAAMCQSHHVRYDNNRKLAV